MPEKVVNTPMNLFAIDLLDQSGPGLPMRLARIARIPGHSGDVAEITGNALQAMAA
jgi:hypothetical protein